MWTREMIKSKAKAVLGRNYWQAFVVSLVIILAGGSHNGISNGGSSGRNGNDYINYNGVFNGIFNIRFRSIILFGISIVIILIILRVLLGYLLEVGGRKFFIRAAEGETNIHYLGYFFSQGRYADVLLTMLLRSIYTFLWTLLFIIPGIVKGYAYRMVPYILADNPSIGYNRAIELSNEMTRGEKWELFVLDLSFLGWYLLGALALIVGTLFILPYDNAANAELYLILRKDAIERGLTSYEELNLAKSL